MPGGRAGAGVRHGRIRITGDGADGWHSRSAGRRAVRAPADATNRWQSCCCRAGSKASRWKRTRVTCCRFRASSRWNPPGCARPVSCATRSASVRPAVCGSRGGHGCCSSTTRRSTRSPGLCAPATRIWSCGTSRPAAQPWKPRIKLTRELLVLDELARERARQVLTATGGERRLRAAARAPARAGCDQPPRLHSRRPAPAAVAVAEDGTRRSPARTPGSPARGRAPPCRPPPRSPRP